MRLRGEGEIGAIVLRAARLVPSSYEQHDRRSRSTNGAIDEHDRRAVQSPAKSVLPLSLSLSDLGSLFSLSLSLFFRKLFEVKMRV